MDKKIIEGNRMYEFANTIFPICRSITGEGVRKTLFAISQKLRENNVKLEMKSVPCGTKVFDWTVPMEWVIRNGYIENESGKHIIDFNNHNLHVMGYSQPIDKWVSLDELKEYVFTQKDQPDVIPYVTSYYNDRVGFCMSENQLNSLPEGSYHMFIDSEFVQGELNYGEVFISSTECNSEEVFFSTYICHPSMANNECSGPALACELIKYISLLEKRRYNYRFVFVPETIGAISFLSQNNNLHYLKKNMVAGFNLSCVGDDNDYSIVETRYANTLSDKILKNVLHFYTNDNYSTYTFLKRGSDERQYNAPGVDLPVACFCRSKFCEYPEYHTSADNMEYISPKGFQGSYDVMRNVIDGLEWNYKYRIKVFCEPQLGKRGLHVAISKKGSYDRVRAMTNFIAYADGTNDLFDISNKIEESVNDLIPIVKRLMEEKLIETV